MARYRHIYIRQVLCQGAQGGVKVLQLLQGGCDPCNKPYLQIKYIIFHTCVFCCCLSECECDENTEISWGAEFRVNCHCLFATAHLESAFWLASRPFLFLPLQSCQSFCHKSCQSLCPKSHICVLSYPPLSPKSGPYHSSIPRWPALPAWSISDAHSRPSTTLPSSKASTALYNSLSELPVSLTWYSESFLVGHQETSPYHSFK